MFSIPTEMLLLLGAATVLAAILQTATGIGFGLIAGPFVLMALQGREAILATALLSLLITLVLVPKLLPDVNRRDLVNLSIGCAVGLPVGALVYLYADIVMLKLGAAALILFTLGMMMFPVRAASGGANKSDGEKGRFGAIAAGVSAGVLGVCLAMPGPVAAVFMIRQGRGKAVVRATMLTFFVFALGAALTMQIFVDGLSTEVLQLSALLAPACVVGLVIGHFAAKRISERAFLRLLQIVLVATVISLFASSYAEFGV